MKSWHSFAVCATVAAAMSLAVLPGLAMEVAGPASIIDGDTIEVEGVTIRLHGIDAAETGQRCVSPGRKIARPGDMAANELAVLAKSPVKCTGTEYDQYSRLIAVCTSSTGENINQALVSRGLAWAFVKYSSDFVADEVSARNRHLGVWNMTCDTPWEFRAKRWEATAQKAPNGCPIKGNVSENGRIYHMPWNRHYAKTKIDTSKGERWFCDEKEAVAAGWRAAKQ